MVFIQEFPLIVIDKRLDILKLLPKTRAQYALKLLDNTIHNLQYTYTDLDTCSKDTLHDHLSMARLLVFCDAFEMMSDDIAAAKDILHKHKWIRSGRRRWELIMKKRMAAAEDAFLGELGEFPNSVLYYIADKL